MNLVDETEEMSAEEGVMSKHVSEVTGNTTAHHLDYMRRSRGDRSVLLASMGAHLLGVIGLFTFGGAGEAPPEEVIAVELASAAALGDPAQLEPVIPPSAEPDLEQPPSVTPEEVTPPPEESLSISNRLKEQREKQKTKRKPQKRKPKPPKPPKRKQKKKKKKRKTKQKTADPFKSSSRAPVEADPFATGGGRSDGVAGSSQSQGQGSTVNIHISRIRSAISRQFKRPSSISPRKIKRLKATIYIKLKMNTKRSAHIASHKVISKSGVRDFDRAAVTAVERFYKGGLKLPLPKDQAARAALLKSGLNLVMQVTR